MIVKTGKQTLLAVDTCTGKQALLVAIRKKKEKRKKEKKHKKTDSAS